jgi:hypothetical protein
MGFENEKVFWCSAFRYVVPADYENWFEELAAEGWHPVKVGQWSSIAMRFAKGGPKKYRYVVDMQPFPKKEYRQTYEDFGWEFVGQMASAMVWRREYENERPESFSDAQSLHGRGRRFIGAASVSFILFLLGAVGFGLGAAFAQLSASDRLQFGIAAAFFLALASAMGAVLLKMRRNMDR